MITQKELKDNFSYNTDTGIFIRLTFRSPKALISKEAGSKTSQGYLSVYFDTRSYLLHRLAWLYVYGEWPKHQIDHINHDRTDNRLCNLRAVTHKDNGRNAKKPSTNTSGCVGIHFRKDANKWRPVIMVNNKNISLGYYKNKEDAIKVRKEAEIKYNFHENHGK